ncbi:MAG: hypothetical protein J6P03_02490, partial [Opitutales bacterium]|nr:hypothetical protein [Opitutales bacterium]
KRATSRLGWTIVEMGEDENASAEQAAFLEDFYNNIRVSSAADANKHGSMSMLIENILSALENQFAVSEIIWDTSDAPNLSAEVRSVPLWFFENTQGYLRFKRSSFDTEGVEMEKNGWLVADSCGISANRILCGETAWSYRYQAMVASSAPGEGAAAKMSPADVAMFLGIDELRIAKERLENPDKSKSTILPANKVFAFNARKGGRDWQKVVNLYDNEKAFIYFDPPYCTGDSGIYDAWTPEDMQILRNSLYSLKGKWLLSCDGSDICREIFADFAKIEVPFKYSSGTQYVGRPVKSEMLVACDSLADAMHANFNAVQNGKRWRAAA